MKYNIEEIEIFSRCPRMYRLSNGKFSSSAPRINFTLYQAMKLCYQRMLETGEIIPWQRVRNYIFKYSYRGNIDLNKLEAVKRRKALEKQLNSIYEWYHKFYKYETIETYTDVVMTMDIAPNEIIATVPFVTPSEIPTVTCVGDVPFNAMYLYNSLYYRSLIAILSNSLKKEKTRLRYISRTKSGTLSIQEHILEYEKNARMAFFLNQITGSMTQGISYPSISKQCISCYYKDQCQL